MLLEIVAVDTRRQGCEKEGTRCKHNANTTQTCWTRARKHFVWYQTRARAATLYHGMLQHHFVPPCGTLGKHRWT